MRLVPPQSLRDGGANRVYDLLLGTRNFDVIRVLDLSWWAD
jgi:hypothetical protein